MSTQQKFDIWKSMARMCLIAAVVAFILWGCANNPRTLDRSISGPQVIVSPETIRLGVAKVMATEIVFEGAGFKTGDSVLIILTGPKETKVIAAEAPIKPDGAFVAKVSKLTRAMEILRADIGFDENFKDFIIITQPPIPEGVYVAKVTSMISKQTAETKLTFKGPSVIDSLKDWIGSLTGKIRHKKAK